MTTTLLDLKDRIVTDSGRVVAKYDLIVKKALSGEVFTDFPVIPHGDIQRYLDLTNQTMEFWKDDGILDGPAPESYDWNIPPEFKSLDVYALCWELLGERAGNPEYQERLEKELILVRERQMEDFIRCLLYVTSVFRENNVVWGIGRGSSCASLVLFVLGINKVDPVKYQISMEEFYK